MKLRQILTQIDALDGDLTIYVAASERWSLDAEATTAVEELGNPDWTPPDGYVYFLEVQFGPPLG
ncbi:MAG: hypothetical protein ABI725_05965 [Chloroflexota bacterium]